MRRYDITDQQWQRIAHLLPGKVGYVGRSAIDNRLFINAVLWVARSGAPWRDLPERFGSWKRSGVPVGLSAGLKQTFGKTSLRSYKSRT